MVDHQLQNALATLWRIPRPGPDNLLSATAFVSLNELCKARYGNGDATFALSNALRSLGLPCQLLAKHANLALDLPTAADAIELAFTRKTTVRRHLCPLDLADDLPPISFGTSRVAKFSSAELEWLFDVPRLTRNYQGLQLEAQRFAQFHWLVVEEEVTLDPRPEARASPFLFVDMSQDFGEIDPHLGRLPPAVETALFFLLLAPWEEWSTLQQLDWRGFRIPWIYTADEDLFARPARPPSVESLSLEPWIVENGRGEEIELERPKTLPLVEGASAALQLFTEDLWTQLQAACATSLFEPPIVHFLVRAFLADGVDEVMAHMTAIEAILGLEADYRGKLRPKPDPHSKLSPTQRVAARVAGVLDDAKAALDYEKLFELRSVYSHGRPGVQKISTQQRVLARSLARRVAYKMVVMATQHAPPRAEVMADLLNQGIDCRQAPGEFHS